jgi:hypothetical protein
MKVVDAYLEPILHDVIRKAKDLHGRSKDDFDEDETLLDHLIKYTSGESCSFSTDVLTCSLTHITKDPATLHDETLNILIAGRDTVSTSCGRPGASGLITCYYRLLGL